MIPDNITKEHLGKAIEEIDKEGIPKGRQSFKYDLEYNKKKYPPLLVVSYANRIANGEEFAPNTLGGGPSSEAFKLLENEGFTIVEKAESNHYEIIMEYLSELKSGKIKAANSIKLLIAKNDFENNLKVIDRIFFDNKLKTIDSTNYTDIIDFLKEQHKITSEKYNDFNIWSASKTHLKKRNQELIARHDELNNKVGFPDNGNGLYKSFLGEKNLISFIKDRFKNTSLSIKQYWLYSPGENARNWEEFYNNGIIGLGWDEIGDLKQYHTRDEIKSALVNAYGGKGSKKNDVSANDDFLKKINIGDVIIAKKGRGELLGYGVVISNYAFDENRNEYKHIRKVDWKLKGHWKVNFSLVLKTLTDITKYSSDHAEYDTYYERLLGIMRQNNETKILSDMKLSLNTILYGPPGTGKTHILKNQYMDMFTSSESSITRQDFLKDIIQNCSWWQVIALAVLELGKTKVADIFNHEYVQVKAQLSNSTTVTPTIWGQLQSHTIEDCEHVKVSRRMPPMIFNKTEKSEWEILQNEVEEQSPELLELKSQIENFESVPNKRIERFEFLTFHQSYSYEDFIEGIKPELAESDVSYKIEEGVFQKMCNKARNDYSNNYAIFIDEINRGNISSIFGELITLIEDDKREGKSNEIKATLPYSKKHFSVPHNLYIIGTMNTADRSVEALDTALRRRFSFIEMNPDPAKLSTEEFKCTGIDLEALLRAINNRIEKLLDKDYCIGHSYFMTIKNRQSPLEEIKNIFQNKILPLLQEYFYGDWGKILLVIGKEFIATKENTIKFLSTDSYEDFEEYDEKPIYNFTNPSSWTIDSFKSIYE